MSKLVKSFKRFEAIYYNNMSFVYKYEKRKEKRNMLKVKKKITISLKK